VVQIQSEPSARPGDSGTVGVTPGILPARSVRSKLLRARSKSRWRVAQAFNLAGVTKKVGERLARF
jgi:hypothetical protein